MPLNFFRSLFCKSKVSTANIDLGLTESDQEVLGNISDLIVIGKIMSIRAHKDPKMTKVQVTECDLGEGKTEQILCGGVNIAEGIYVPIATVGTVLGEDFTIGERDIRGELSRGMICAKSELGLSGDGEKKGEIWILPETVGSKLGVTINSL